MASKETLRAEIVNKEFMLRNTSFTDWGDYAFAVRTLQDAYEALVNELEPTEKAVTISSLLARIETYNDDVATNMIQKAIDDYGFRPNEHGEMFSPAQVAGRETRANAFILDLVDSWVDCL